MAKRLIDDYHRGNKFMYCIHHCMGYELNLSMNVWVISFLMIDGKVFSFNFDNNYRNREYLKIYLDYLESKNVGLYSNFLADSLY